MKNKLRCIFVFSAIIILAASSGFAAEMKFPKPIGYVNDFAGVIDPAIRAKIAQLSTSLKEKTGVEMATVTVKSVEPLEYKQYANELFKKWGIGRKKYDDGLLILVALKERSIKIETGYGLEGTLPDGFCGRVIDEEIIPKVKENNIGEGLYLGTLALSQKIIKDYKPVTVGKRKSERTSFLVKVAAVLFIIFFVLGIVAVRNPKSTKYIFGGIIGAIFGFIFAGIIGVFIGAVVGALISTDGGRGRFFGSGFPGGFSGGGFSGGSFGGGGGFGGFSGGSSGGGGAGRSW